MEIYLKNNMVIDTNINLGEPETYETADKLMKQRFIHIQRSPDEWVYIPTREIALITGDKGCFGTIPYMPYDGYDADSDY